MKDGKRRKQSHPTARVELGQYIVADPEICHGQPTFNDIADFSEHSQTYKPEDLFNLLNQYDDAALAGVHRGSTADDETPPEDGPSRFYLDKIDDLKKQTLPDSWKGVIEMKEK